ncbi:pentapeptide repeat-containing protein [Demequina sp. SO4-13]|uniref:pentapeptide repeat-containing protein n=1 Tax=Demequina sp. SO4-13 TaxID=3401027 RepID=UPI003AF7E923
MTLQIAAPRPEPVTLDRLARADAYDLDEGPHWHDLDLSGLDFGDRDLTDASFLGCDLSRAVLEGGTLRGVELTGCRAEALAAASLNAPASEWRRCEIARSRIGAAELHGGEWAESVVSGSKFGYLNLRGSRLADVLFEDCVFGDLDLMDARLTRVAFRDCTVRTLSVRRAALADVDLRGLEIAGLDDPASLRGAAVSSQQLLDLAPLLAAHLGLLVDDA